jgi:hypothetical protein
LAVFPADSDGLSYEEKRDEETDGQRDRKRDRQRDKKGERLEGHGCKPAPRPPSSSYGAGALMAPASPSGLQVTPADAGALT